NRHTRKGIGGSNPSLSASVLPSIAISVRKSLLLRQTRTLIGRAKVARQAKAATPGSQLPTERIQRDQERQAQPERGLRLRCLNELPTTATEFRIVPPANNETVLRPGEAA